ncbi:MAG TPA: DUF3565 domain-containing protein [Acidimicrobiales bacterium]|jgi:tellurite resistance-related uncharacterized protein
MRRAITDFHRENDDWVAELVCGHNQHVRHRPPFQERTWVLTALGRAARLGTPLACPLCDRAELPEGLRLIRTSPEWNAQTVPVGLRRAHRLATGTWGTIVVHEGTLEFSLASDPPLDTEVTRHSIQPIPPDIDHGVQPKEHVRFFINFFVVDRHTTEATLKDSLNESSRTSDHIGDPSCWAALLCPDCGVVLDDGEHRRGCSIDMECNDY